MKTQQNKLSAYLQYSWWKYLLILFVVVFLCTTVFSSIIKPKANEQVAVQYFGDGLDVASINEYLEQNLAVITPQPVLQAKFYLDVTDISSIGELLAVRIIKSDVIIIREDMLVPNPNGVRVVQVEDFFEPLKAEEFSAIWQQRGHGAFDQSQLFCKDGVPYGIYVNDGNATTPGATQNVFESYYSGTPRCVALFSDESVNLCGMFGKGNATDGAAIDLVAHILESKN